MTLPASRVAPVPPPSSTLPQGRAPKQGALVESAAIKAAPNAPFLLAVSATNWEIAQVDGKEVWLPVLTPIIMTPGVNMVRTLDRHQVAGEVVRHATRYAEDRGLQVLPHTEEIPAELLPKGVPAGPYIREYDARQRPTDALGVHYREAWDVPVETPPGEAQAFRFDRESHNRWRAHLVASGKVRPPSELVRERARQRIEQRVERIRVTPYPDADLKRERLGTAVANAKAAASAQVPA